LLDTYEAERRPVAAEVLKNRQEHEPPPGSQRIHRLFRDFVFVPMMRLPRVQRKLQAGGSQLNVSYRGGPLVSRPGLLSRIAWAAHSGPRAGDRAPNAPCLLQPAGEPTTLGAQSCKGWRCCSLAATARTVRLRGCRPFRLGKDVRIVRIVRAPRHGAG